MSASDSSSTPDFAFEPPSMGEPSGNPFDLALKTPNNTYNLGIPTSAFTSNNTFNVNQYQPPSMGYSSASSFSSTSGSAAGTSFSPVDALPAISRDFARPNSNETRRPATAAGALQSIGGMTPRGSKPEKPETISEGNEGLFTDPFSEKDESKQLSSQDNMDPYTPTNRRASEPQFNNPLNIQSSWPQPQSATPEHSAVLSPHNQTYPLTSAPANVTGFGLVAGPNIHSQMQQLNRAGAMSYGSRPQTSDGIPSYGSINPNGVSLPSARTIANQIDSPQGFVQPQAQFYGNPSQPYRDNRAASLGDVHAAQQQYQPGRHQLMNYGDKYSQGQDGKDDTTFVPLGAPTHGGPSTKKRPRRRYDEIERLYGCGWNGCEKSYGTLNHLNAHVAMQKHGEKRLPTEFKDMRKAWRKKKRDQAAVAANAQYMATTSTWNPRQSISSSESDYDRRDSAISAYSVGTDYSSHRGSLVYSSGGYPGWHDSSRPTTSSSVTSSADGRFPIGVQGGYAHGMINTAPAQRRPSVPTHMSMPAANGYEHSMPPQQNSFPHPGHAMHPAHHYPAQQAQRPMSQGQLAFGSLTTPMPMPMMAGGGVPGTQFAFQR